MRAPRSAYFAVALTVLVLLGEVARRTVWGGGRWTDLAVPGLLISLLVTTYSPAARTHPRLTRWMRAVNLALALAILAWVVSVGSRR